jgi:hypothetical protein
MRVKPLRRTNRAAHLGKVNTIQRFASDVFSVALSPEHLGRLACAEPEETLEERESREAQEDAQCGTMKNASPEELERLLKRIPAIEADVISLHLQGVNEEAIAEFFSSAQSTISYRISRGLQRLRILAKMPELSPEDAEKALVGRMGDVNAKIVAVFLRETCQSTCAKGCQVSQTRVNYTLRLCLRKLQELAERTETEEKIRETLCIYVKEKCWNLLREVPSQRSRWKRAS